MIRKRMEKKEKLVCLLTIFYLLLNEFHIYPEYVRTQLQSKDVRIQIPSEEPGNQS
jgi:hypothetical protein